MMVAEDEITPDTTGESSLTIEQVAAATGLTKRTLRYYEEVGLLPPTGRTEGNYRRYTQDDLQRLQSIKNLRDLLGFSLADIRVIMEAEDERGEIRLAYCHETEAVAKIAHLNHANELLHHQLELIEQKIAGLLQMRSSLLGKIERNEQKQQDLQKSIDNQQNT